MQKYDFFPSEYCIQCFYLIFSFMTTVFFFRSRDSSRYSDSSVGCTTDETWFDFQQEQKNLRAP